MKKVLTTKALFLTTLALIFFQALQAKHIIGGELYYECLGFTNGDPASNSRSYQIFMRLYRDAVGGGADFDSAPVSQISATVSVYRSNGDLLFTICVFALRIHQCSS